MDFLGMMKQASQLQSKMQEMQTELETAEVEGAAGGGLVTMRLNGKGDLKGLSVDSSLMKADEKEVLEDLLIAAHADAKRRVETLVQEKMQTVTGGLSLPPGLKLF